MFNKKFIINFLTLTMICFEVHIFSKQQSYTSIAQIIKNQTQETMIKLYVYPTCPYCKKVVDYLQKSNNLDKVTLIDATKPQNLQQLLQLSGATQCPYLYDVENEYHMPESDDIIEYLKNLFA